MEGMTEEYKGVKFACSLTRERLSDRRIEELIGWCRKFDRLGLCPSYGSGNAGNFSFRTDKGFIITASACFYKGMTSDELCEVTKVDMGTRTVYAEGIKNPSSEAMLHWTVYRNRPDVNAVFHGHCKKILENPGDLPVTGKEAPYGTPELAEEVKKLLSHDFIIMKNHGFLSLGKTMSQAGTLALKEFNSI